MTQNVETQSIKSPETALASQKSSLPWRNWSAGAALLGIIAVGCMPWLVDRYPGAEAFSITFVSIVLEAFPFIILGAFVGGFIEVFISQDRLARWLPKNRVLAVLLAGLGGLVLPVCECAVVPVTRRLLRKGLPLPAAIAYLLAAPLVNPLVAASTAIAYLGSYQMLTFRMIGGYVVAVTVALIAGAIFAKRSPLLDQQAAEAQAGCGHHHHHHHDHDDHCGHSHEHNHDHAQQRSLRSRLGEAILHATDDFILVGQFLVIGSLIAAGIHTVLNRQDMVTLTDMPIPSTLLMMGLALGLNLCSEADAFVAASFRSLLPFVAQLGFLVLGPMMDLKLAAMYLTFLKKQAALVLIGLICVAVFVYTMIIQFAFGGLIQ